MTEHPFWHAKSLTIVSLLVLFHYRESTQSNKQLWKLNPLERPHRYAGEARAKSLSDQTKQRNCQWVIVTGIWAIKM